AAAYHAAGRTAAAIALLEATFKARQSQLGPDHPDTLTVQNNLASAYEERGELARAGAIYRDLLARRKAKLGPDHPDFAAGLATRGSCLLKQGKWDEAETLLRECLRIREAKRPDDWRRLNTMSLLGGSLLGQKKYAEAEPLVVSGYEGMKAREAQLPAQAKPYLTKTAERVVELYAAWGKPEKTAAWRETLKLPKAAAQSKP